MKQNSPRFFNVLRLALLGLGMFIIQISFAQNKTSTEDGYWHEVIWNPVGLPEASDNVELSNSLVIEKDSIVEINNLDIGQNGALTINGTLIVNGSIDMDNNGSYFEMGDSARVIIFGDFLASNKVDVSISSYLIIHGSFNKKGSDGQGNFDVENGNIYIYGEVDGWPNFGDCGEEADYSGTPEESGTCDYGSEEDFINNPDIPDDLLELSNCFDLSDISDIAVCEGTPATFSVALIPDVNYQWQKKISDNANWENIPDETNVEYTITQVTAEMETHFYRVIVKPSETSTSNCKISISREVSLAVTPTPSFDLSVPTAVCENDEVSIIGTISGQPPFEMDVTINGIDSTFIFEDNDLDIILPAEETEFEINELRSGTCAQVLDQTYSIELLRAGWTGETSTDWNTESNWSCMPIPTLEKDVVIRADVPNFPEIKAGETAYVRTLSIEENASLKIIEGEMEIAGDLNSTGIVDASEGTMIFNGSSAQSIPEGVLLNNRIKNLILDNSAGLTNEGTIELTGILLLNNGDFQTNNSLTLISNAIQTALIDGSGNGEIIGEVTMQRYLDRAFGYKYFSSPFQNTVIDDFSPYMDFEDPVTGFPHFYGYNENRNIEIGGNVQDATGWEAYITSGNSLNVAEGYALNFGTSTTAETIELIGEVNNGTIPARQLENNHREYTEGFHLVGNPYPSPIDWDADQGWTKTNIDNGIYFFTASDDSQYTGTYTAYVNDISTAEPFVDGRSSNIIPSMQGFFIKVSDSDTQGLVTGSFGMVNNVRVTDFEQEFLRTQVTAQKSIIRLEAGFKAADRKDPMVIYFSSYATPNFEKEMDAHKLMNTDPAVPSFYNLTENKKELAINAIPFPESRSYKKIPLGIKADQSGEMKINLASLENLSPNFNIYLIDHEKSKGQNLRNKPEYTFSIKKGTHNSRFELMFTEEKVKSPAIAFNEPFDVEVEDGNVVVSLNLEEIQQGTLRASTMTGQILQVREAGGKDKVIFEGITSNGVYIINLTLGNAQYAKKVVIKK